MSTLQPQRQDEPTTQLGFGTRLRGLTFAAARAQVVEALAKEGFGIVSEIDVRATILAKLGIEGPPYLILGACNPALVQQVLLLEPFAGLLLPCNVTLWPEGDEIVVTFANPRALFQLLDTARLRPLVLEVEQRLRGALERLVE